MKAKRLMIQGTSSDAGKSLIVAGLCRVFADRGQKVFPFKSQNMALNSYITASGDEMSRAQVVQAEASRRLPDPRMNPILLKPVGEAQSHVVIKGQFVASTTAAEYYDYKIKLKPVIHDIFQEISQENEVILIEGAGSPAEINLNDHDIVNMGMARIADAPVLLVADIDRGGVFAQIYGTIALMNEEDRARIKGVIINKFRGDISLLQSGIEMIENLTHVPIVGVVPYIDLAIDSEDSIALESVSTQMDPQKAIDVAILMLDKMSNFSDFQSLTVYEDVSVRYVKHIQQLKNPDVLIIPGTEDIHSNYQKILAYKETINLLLAQGTRVIAFNTGVCFLSETVQLSHDRVIPGLGLVSGQATLLETVEITQVDPDDNQQALGGSITQRVQLDHDGDGEPFIQADDYQEGLNYHNHLIMGTQLNGLFQNLSWSRHYFNQIRRTKGLEEMEQPKLSYMEFKNREYDKLANHLLEHLDMKVIEEMMECSEEG
ncbi:cobyric acid synthase [Facklamia lactis]|uniref:cobyric acid synthase n=1 Tax=Facklamia lactis TaxID=2749967 RepID=UPI0018CED8F6|nr:cobyric acid synthase [Facklamia lactis]MBG9979506.1 cobyric acid synthase [Facklamia lactis]